MSRKISNPEVATLESLHSAETVAFPWGLRRNPLSLILPYLYTLTLPRDPKAMRNWCKIEYNWLGSVVEDSGEGPMTIPTLSFQEGMATVNKPSYDDLW